MLRKLCEYLGGYAKGKSAQQLRIICLYVGLGLVFPSFIFAEPAFLNRHVFPLSVSLNEIGPFHNNFLRTFEVLTQWNNPTSNKLNVEIAFIFYDFDSGKNQDGEDGKDDSLMTIVETFTIPDQVGHWPKSFWLTAVGKQLNQGFDHPNEGAGLELYVDAQIMSIDHIVPE